MSWEWSHTIEGLCAAHDNLHQQPREWLEVCWAEIKAATRTEYSWDFDESKYKAALAQAKHPNITEEALANDIWEHASTENRTCSNGGFELYMCPFGCHTVVPHKLCEKCVRMFGEENALPATEKIPGVLAEWRYLCDEHALEAWKGEN